MGGSYQEGKKPETVTAATDQQVRGSCCSSWPKEMAFCVVGHRRRS